MFGISHNIWEKTCDMYFSLSSNSQKAYLQWYPFSKITEKDKKKIISEDFFEQYIASGSFILYSPNLLRMENYIQKTDGSFRDSSLVSPILFLLLQAIGKKISNFYQNKRASEIEVYYAGNYEKMCPKYKHEYDTFYKSVNSYKECSQFFIKTDISSFFQNINLDILFDRIDRICNSDRVNITQTELALYKELLSYCGNGNFPLIENSLASSYLATMVYLDEIDEQLNSFISKEIHHFSSYKMVRYVDDMYILFTTDVPHYGRQTAYNMIRNEYSSILKEYGLALNTGKCCMKPTGEINDELKKSLYDEAFYGERHEIAEQFPDAMYNFLKELYEKLSVNNISLDEYCNLINKHFSMEGLEYTPDEAFNYFIYEDDTVLKKTEIVDIIAKLINQDISFIALDSKRLSVMIMKTATGSNDKTIKSMLNHLFERDRNNLWNAYDTIAAIAYLTQSHFGHIDLLGVLKKRCPGFHEYYSYYCKRSLVSAFDSVNADLVNWAIGSDWKAYYLLFMYTMATAKNNHLIAYSYYKNYFDRVTADIAFRTGDITNEKSPNYKRFYHEKNIINFYSKKLDKKVESTIKKAHKLRNKNPLAHASAELIDDDSSSKEIIATIKELYVLVLDYLLKTKNNK